MCPSYNGSLQTFRRLSNPTTFQGKSVGPGGRWLNPWRLTLILEEVPSEGQNAHRDPKITIRHVPSYGSGRDTVTTSDGGLDTTGRDGT